MNFKTYTQKRILKEGIVTLLNNPGIIPSLLTFDFHQIYCSYFHQKLKKVKKIYQKYENEDESLFNKINLLNQEINKQSDKNNAYCMSLYFLIRELKPDTVVETGVHRGVSSLFILQALHDNKKGKLFSIDLPFAEYITDNKMETKSILQTEKIGICVPKQLQEKWNLILGDSKNELPKILKKINSLDIFLHDSKHTYEHMTWEYKIIWPHLKSNGVLISDDTNWNESFKDFCLENNLEYIDIKRDKKGDAKFSISIKK
jgi:predicted O-methyltransferase YrrM